MNNAASFDTHDLPMHGETIDYDHHAPLGRFGELLKPGALRLVLDDLGPNGWPSSRTTGFARAL